MPGGLFKKVKKLAVAFGVATEATSAIIVALVLPTIVGIGGFAADYSSVHSGQLRLQSVIDSAALAVAREMTLGPIDPARAQSLAEQYVAANIPANTPYSIAVTAALVEANQAVKVSGQQQVATPFGVLDRMIGAAIISTSSLARVAVSSAPQKVCIVSLGEAVDGGIYMHNSAQITAPGCVLQSNSTDKDAIILSAGSILRTGLACARGGVKNMASMVDGIVMTDCPAMADPLASKPEPALSSGCDFNKLTVSSGMVTLKPATYCGGLEITGTAKVTMDPGIYHFKNGNFLVNSSAELRGNGVTLIFNGKKSYFRFEGNALIEILAPSSGATAGMLIWEVKGASNSNTNGKNQTGKLKNSNEHRINSDRARQLTGTIYLKQGLLLIDSTRPIADLSPYTIMVVNKLDLYDGPNLMLNTNYSASTIPVPAGLGYTGATKIRLGM